MFLMARKQKIPSTGNKMTTIKEEAQKKAEEYLKNWKIETIARIIEKQNFFKKEIKKLDAEAERIEVAEAMDGGYCC